MDDFDFDNAPESEGGDADAASTNPSMLCFEEYRDCFGEAREMMKRHLLCNLCGGHLHFNHLADFDHGLIQETARCPDCGIRIRQRLHKLQ